MINILKHHSFWMKQTSENEKFVLAQNEQPERDRGGMRDRDKLKLK